MKRFGLIGYPLSHSFSESYFKNKFKQQNLADCDYKNYEIAHLKELKEIIAKNQLQGLNVTIPYKVDVLEFVDEVSEEVLAIGAANTLKISENSIKAFNTDYLGFTESLEDLPFDPSKKVLILGSGGASKAAKFALKLKKMETIVVSRKSTENTISYQELDESILNSVSLIINTTPLGMYPNTDSYPDIPYNSLNANHFCYDLVYNPEMTTFLNKAKQQGAGVKNGLEMLILQAEASWRIWNEVN